MMTEKRTTRETVDRWGEFFARPSTKLGRWSVALGATFVVLMGVNGAVFMRLPGEVDGFRRTLLIIFGFAMLSCGLGAGIAGLTAVVRQHERSWLVWFLPILVGLFVVFLLAGEVLVPH